MMVAQDNFVVENLVSGCSQEVVSTLQSSAQDTAAVAAGLLLRQNGTWNSESATFFKHRRLLGNLREMSIQESASSSSSDAVWWNTCNKEVLQEAACTREADALPAGTNAAATQGRSQLTLRAKPFPSSPRVTAAVMAADCRHFLGKTRPSRALDLQDAEEATMLEEAEPVPSCLTPRIYYTRNQDTNEMVCSQSQQAPADLQPRRV